MKNGKKNYFANAGIISTIIHLSLFLPWHLMKLEKPEKERIIQFRIKGKQSSNNTLTLSSLAPETNSLSNEESSEEYLDSVNNQASAVKKVKPSVAPVRKKLDISSLSNSDISVDVDLPNGVELDKLNELELKLYSFYLRTATQYVGAIQAEYRDFLMRNPGFNLTKLEEKQFLMGKLSFDKEGNIKRIKMLEWSKIDKLQELFLSSLKRLDKIPNPPDIIINDQDEFTINYSLTVRD